MMFAAILERANVHKMYTYCLDPNLDKEEVLIDLVDYRLKRKDLACCLQYRMLHSDVMNAYMTLLQQRAVSIASPKCLFFITHFYTLLVGPLGYSYAAVYGWTKSLNIFDYDMVVIPIHQPKRMHWVLGVIHLKQKMLNFLDPLVPDTNEDSILYNLAKWVDDEAERRCETPICATDWPRITELNIPGQKDSHNCGVFVLNYAEKISRGATVDFDISEIGYLRKKVVADLYSKSIG